MPWNEREPVWAFTIRPGKTVGLLDGRNVGPCQCTPYDVIEKVMALYAAWMGVKEPEAPAQGFRITY